MKPKSNQKGSPDRDRCQTPSYALTPLLPFLPQDVTVWESASGEGLLALALRQAGYKVVTTDILRGQDFFQYTIADAPGDIQVTNPPFSIKYKWLKQSIYLGKPFALLVPGETMFAKTTVMLWEANNFEALIFRGGKRVDYKMPDKGWSGSGAQFPSFWITWGLNIGQPLTFVDLPKPSKQRLAERALGYEQLSYI